MGSTNWTVMSDSLSVAAIDRGVTHGIARPPGGGDFVYGFNSIALSGGAVALFANQSNFAPMAKGGRISGAIKRGVSGGPEGFAPFFFIGGQGPSVNDRAYVLALADDDPYHIVLRKSVIATQHVDAAPDPPNNGVLLRSTQAYAPDVWHHLRLDMIVNDNGDVILQVFENDLALHPLGTAPTWVAVPGMVEFIDDALGINSGSAALTSGRAGFGMWNNDVTRRSYFDWIELARAL